MKDRKLANAGADLNLESFVAPAPPAPVSIPRPAREARTPSIFASTARQRTGSVDHATRMAPPPVQGMRADSMRRGLAGVGEWLRDRTARRGQAAGELQARLDALGCMVAELSARVDEIAAAPGPEASMRRELEDLRGEVEADFSIVAEQLRAEAERGDSAAEQAVEQITRLSSVVHDLAGKLDMVDAQAADLERRIAGRLEELRRMMQSSFGQVQGRLEEESARGVQARRATSDQLAQLAPLLVRIVDKLDGAVLSSSELEERLGQELEQTRESMRSHFALVEQRLQAEASRNARANQALTGEIARLEPVVAGIGARVDALREPSLQIDERVRAELAEMRHRLSHALAEMRQQLTQELDELRVRSRSNYVYFEDRLRDEAERNSQALRELSQRVDDLYGLLTQDRVQQR